MIDQESQTNFELVANEVSIQTDHVNVSCSPSKLNSSDACTDTETDGEQPIKEHSSITQSSIISNSKVCHNEESRDESELEQLLGDLKISFLNFRINDIALFLAIDDNKQQWMAFHSSRPYYFLAKESYEYFLTKDKKQNKPARTRIVGKIVFIEHLEATDEYNPYKLAVGTSFHICYVEPVLITKKR